MQVVGIIDGMGIEGCRKWVTSMVDVNGVGYVSGVQGEDIMVSSMDSRYE